MGRGPEWEEQEEGREGGGRSELRDGVGEGGREAAFISVA